MKNVYSFLNKINLYRLLQLAVMFIIIALFGCQSQDNNENYRLLFEDKGLFIDMEWSPDGKQIVYRPLTDEPYYETLNLETNSTTSIPVPGQDNAYVLDLIWISNEEIAYVEKSSESSKYTIAIYNLLEQSTEEFWETDLQLFELCWLSTEQKLIVLTTFSNLSFDVAFGNTILIYKPSNKDFRPIYQTRENKVTDIICSPNENKIAFTEFEGGLSTNWLYTLTTTPPRQIQLLNETEFRVDSPSWSPNGDWVVVRSIKGSQSRQRRGLMLVSADGSKVHEIEDVPWSRGALIDVRWSPVGNTLLVRLISGGFSPNRFSLALYDIIPPSIQQEE